MSGSKVNLVPEPSWFWMYGVISQIRKQVYFPVQKSVWMKVRGPVGNCVGDIARFILQRAGADDK